MNGRLENSRLAASSSFSCFSGGTAQPATETLAYALRQEGYEVALDDKKLKEINDFFSDMRSEMWDADFAEAEEIFQEFQEEIVKLKEE